MERKEDEEWKRFKGTKKLALKKVRMVKWRLCMFMEKYDEKLWCLVARKVWDMTYKELKNYVKWKKEKREYLRGIHTKVNLLKWKL